LKNQKTNNTPTQKENLKTTAKKTQEKKYIKEVATQPRRNTPSIWELTWQACSHS
jgi:hypothetical protein